MSRVRKRKSSSTSSRGGRSTAKESRGNIQRSSQKSKSTSTQGRRGKRKAKKKKRVLRNISIILFIGLIFTASGLLFITSKANKIFVPKPTNPTVGDKEPEGSEKEYSFKESELYTYDRKKDEERYLNILVMGIDGENRNQRIDSWTRTDAMMLVSLDKETNKTNIISIPRDIYSDKINSTTQKINSAHAVGGPYKAIEVVEDIFDTKVDNYIKINYQGFRDFIDAIGGVYVEIDRDMIYDDEGQDLKIRFNKGDKLTLKGKKAEEYIRWRKNNEDAPPAVGGGSDFARIEKMQYFIGQVIKELASVSTVFEINDILDSIANNVETDMEPGTIVDLALKINKIKSGVEMHTPEVFEGNQFAPNLGKIQSYYFIDDKNIINTLKLFHGDGYINKRYLRIKIENCTSKSGLAADFGKFLRGKRYGNLELTDGIKREESVVIINNRLDEYTRKVFEDEVNMDNIQYTNDSSEYFDVIIKLGKDHDYIR
ncbi:LCP family protein [Oceanirhabdus sp. W0125-5]|uniref:LCP family protein n=1 Tax=Oceanirhabdus sp. W0125-5 TaxID=2999116 RepID=UPI0022F31620|nr:LCP family protein [Oceanirhabdus sp. W0125-5]WBW96781.1 LCP family protein [Oceanirhabdus sp. W0125-5]